MNVVGSSNSSSSLEEVRCAAEMIYSCVLLARRLGKSRFKVRKLVTNLTTTAMPLLTSDLALALVIADLNLLSRSCYTTADGFQSLLARDWWSTEISWITHR